MTEIDYARTLEELDRLLNDPDVPLQPALIWHLLDEVAKRERLSSFVGVGPERRLI